MKRRLVLIPQRGFGGGASEGGDNLEPGAGTKYSPPTVRNPDVELAEVNGGDFRLQAREGGPTGNELTVGWGRYVSWPQGTQFTGGGYEMRCESPQDFTARLQIYRKTWYHYFDYPPLALRFVSDDGETLGYEHAITYRSGLVYRLWANCCQVFLSAPGCNGADHTAFQGGIPFVPDQERADVNQIWWSAGDRAHYFGMESLRTRLTASWPASACVNTDVTWGSNPEGGGAPRILTLGPGWDWYRLWHPGTRMIYRGGTPFYIDPLIAWGRPGEK